MEDPISFDVYGRINKQLRDDAIFGMRSNVEAKRELEIRKMVNGAINGNFAIRVAGGLSLADAKKIICGCPWLFDAALYQQGFGPEDNTFFCTEHELHYGGVHGCHVCSGFFR